MKDTYIDVRLVAPDLIRFVSLSDIPFSEQSFFLIKDGNAKNAQKLVISRNVGTPSHSFFEFRLQKALELGHSYFVYIPSYGKYPLDVNEATTFSNFDSLFTYEGELGSFYKKNETTWKLWAPLASKVSLAIKDGEKDILYPMLRGEKGVYSLTLKGDFLLKKYRYYVTNSEIETISIDPYGKASSPNGKESVVIDEGSLRKDFYKDRLPKMSSITDAIIYEANVRDLTIDKHSNIESKGTFKGLIEKGKTTKEGHQIGFDYLKMLGFTHLQLQPLNDFGSVDETKGFKDYNWGYDPIQYFVPEGSYSSDPFNPLSRIEEIQEMVQTFHKEGIRIVLDVVFNHVYEYLDSSFEKIVPNYFFRKDQKGRMLNCSGCGDDVDSERPMVRKLIKDVCSFWQDFYGIDGFRFDLMGLIDAKTMLEIEKDAQKKDPSFIIYGEGWNMYSSKSMMANLSGAKSLPSLSFFNDSFRENVKSYAAGDLSKKEAFKYSLIGSCHPWGTKESIFLDAKQSINYIECHDNATYFDFLTKYFDYSDQEKLEIVKFGLASVIFSFGVPFLHMGQEIGQSKFLNENTYNAGDIYNKMSDNLLDSRFDMGLYCSGAIKVRKSLSIFKESNPTHLAKMIDFEDFDNGLLMKVKDETLTSCFKEIDFLFNPTKEALTYSFKEDREILFTSGGPALGVNLLGRNILLPRHSLIIVALKK